VFIGKPLFELEIFVNRGSEFEDASHSYTVCAKRFKKVLIGWT